MKFRIIKKKGKVRLEKRKPRLAICSICKTELKGVLRERPYKMRNTAKTKKRPERMYGGVLCSRCAREKIRRSVWENA